jgi:autotransporter passenger strand-loop-strand repeat protein
LTVLSGGSAVFIVLSGGYEVIAGGTAISTTVSGDADGDLGIEFVSAGGMASGTVLRSVSFELVSSGGVASGTVVSNLGFQYVLNGGVASAAVVSSGGNEIVSGGTARGTVVSNGGSVVVFADGVASGTVVDDGGAAAVSGGGVLSGTVVSGGGSAIVASSGVTSFTVVSNGGSALVYSGGVASDTVVSYGGNQFVFSGGVVTGTVVSGGNEYVGSDGVASGTVIRLDGAQRVDDFGVASGTVVSDGGYQDVLQRGMVYGTVVSDGGSAVVTFLGEASGTILRTDGTQIVSELGTATGTVVGPGGYEVVSAYGSTTQTVVSSGGKEVVVSSGVVSGTVLSGGFEIVTAGGSASGTVISSGGDQSVSAGGATTGTIITSSGKESVGDEGAASGTIVSSGGTETVSAHGVASGTVVSNGGTETVSAFGLVSGTVVSDGGTENVSTNAAASGTVVSSGGAELVFTGGSATLTSMVIGGTIDVTYLAYVDGGSAGFDSTTDVLTVSVGGHTYQQTLAGDQSDQYFQLARDATHGGTDIILASTPCYCRGTRILTDRGEVPVEALRIGDLVATLSGALRPIRWIGHRRLEIGRHQAPPDVCPVRIAAGALADCVPARELLVSPDHAVLVAGLLVPARLLLNGASVTREDSMRHVTYFHVELDTHDILFAEGAPAESYLDTGNRDAFDNAGLPPRLHPDFAGDQRLRAVASCLLLATAPALVEPIWRAVAERAASLGWRLPGPPPMLDDPDLHILADGRRIAPVICEQNRYVFALPACDQAPRLVSHAARPSDSSPWLDDRRRLGVQIVRMAVRHRGNAIDIPLDHPMLADGWWHVEMTNRGPCRWTNGNAALPSVRGGLVEVKLAGHMQYLPRHDQPEHNRPNVVCPMPGQAP